MTALGEVRAVTPGAARRIDRCSCRQGVEDLVHDRFLDVEQSVARCVIGLSPLAVTGLDVASPDVNARVRGEPWVVQKGPYLGEPGVDELLVEVAGPCPQKRDALQSQQV